MTAPKRPKNAITIHMAGATFFGWLSLKRDCVTASTAATHPHARPSCLLQLDEGLLTAWSTCPVPGNEIHLLILDPALELD